MPTTAPEEPPRPTRQQLQAQHGTPAEFELAVWKAYTDLMVTADEAAVAIHKYRQEWAEAS